MGILIALTVSCFIRESTIFGINLRTTTKMHLAMCERVLRANILFFDSNPMGRIITRFSKDMAVLDLIAPAVSILMTYGIFRALTVAISLVLINYWLLIPAFFSLFYLIYLMRNAKTAMIQA